MADATEASSATEARDSIDDKASIETTSKDIAPASGDDVAENAPKEKVAEPLPPQVVDNEKDAATDSTAIPEPPIDDVAPIAPQESGDAEGVADTKVESNTNAEDNKDANADATELTMAKQGGLKRSFTVNGQAEGRAPAAANGHSAANDLAGLDMSNIGPAEAKALKAPNLASAAHLSPNWERGFNRLLTKADGVLYEDGQIQVGVRSEYRGQMACLILYFTNKTPALISSFTTTLDLDVSEKANLTWDVKGLPDTTIAQGAQAQQVIMFEAKRVFDKSPTIRISYLAGALQALTLKLPVTIHKFMDPAELSAEDFFKRWKQIGGAPREAQQIFGLAAAGGGSRAGEREITEGFVRAVVEGFRWGVLNGVDPNGKNVVGASVVHTSEGGKYGCLLRLEPNYQTQVRFFPFVF